MIRLSAAVLVVVLGGSAHAAEGELCFVQRTVPDCRAVSGERVRVVPAATARPFVWWNDQRTDVALGVLPGGADTISREGWRSVPVLLDGDDPQSWPQPVTIRWKRGGSTIETTAGARAVATLRRIQVQRAEGTLELTAPHHRPVERVVAQNAAPTIRFARYPTLSGMVVDAETRVPFAGANVLLPSSELLGTTAADGRFVADVTDDWPARIRIEAPQRAARTIELPRAVRSFDAGVVELSRGGTLRVHIEREDVVAVEVKRGGERIAERSASRGVIEIAGLAPGTYALAVRGARSLQRLTMPFTIRDLETTDVTPDVNAVDLLVRVRAGARAVAGAKIVLGPAGGSWEATVTTDDDGVARNELWERGEFGAFVTAPGIDTFAHRSLAGSSDIEWIIEAPGGRVSGIVRDAASGSAIRGANVVLETSVSDGGTQTSARSDDAGRFSFENVAAGAQTLTVDADGYVRGSRFLHLEAAEEVTIRLERALEQALIVSLANGRPAAGALLVDAATLQQWVADDAGQGSIGFRAGEQKTLYVLPREGSFAAVDVAAPKGAPKPLHATVPSGDATIVIHARSTTGVPLGGIRFAVRYNGRVLTEAVRNALHRQLGFPFATGSDGTAMLRNVPLGLYELWPYADGGERQAIEWGIGQPPVSLAARPGINDVILTFTK